MQFSFHSNTKFTGQPSPQDVNSLQFNSILYVKACYYSVKIFIPGSLTRPNGVATIHNRCFFQWKSLTLQVNSRIQCGLLEQRAPFPIF